MKHLKQLLIAFLSITLLYSCEKSDIDAPENLEIQEFIWRGMNTFYLWQEDVTDLSDTRFSSQGQLNNFLQDFSNPADLFQHLRFQPGVTDRFSFFTTDFIALENSFQGINFSNGMELGLVGFANGSQNVFGYVRYVVPNSDAASKNVVRGMLFTHVDGTQLTQDNFRGLLFSSDTRYTITLADFNNGNPTPNGTDIELIESELVENPIAIAKVIEEGADKIGYLMYNQFSSAFDQQLNTAFATFQAEGVTDLIVDLRYNGGGSVRTAVFLSSMITGQFNGQVFSRETWNSKITSILDEEDLIENFTNQLVNGTVNEPINNLNLTRVYFITTRNTASASELVMNSLAPYVNVFSVGTTTIGKVHGSNTFYDSDNFRRDGSNLNPNHTWAIQPLTFETRNRDGINNPQGIVPTVELQEDFENLGVLGERSDPLLDRTINLILNGNRNIFITKEPVKLSEFNGSRIQKLSKNHMYK